MVLQLRRWLPEREIIVVGDNTYSAIEWLDKVRRHAAVITRLRLDARLFAPAPPRRPGTLGRPRRKGERLPSLSERLADTPVARSSCARPPGSKSRRPPSATRWLRSGDHSGGRRVFSTSSSATERVKIPRAALERITDALAYTV